MILFSFSKSLSPFPPITSIINLSYFSEYFESLLSQLGYWDKNIISNELPYENNNEVILILINQNSTLIKETSEFKSIILEVIKNGIHNNINNINSNNKTFNLQFFLNETCKDAMNIMDFVDSLKLQLSDLENVGKIGYVEGSFCFIK